MIKVRATQDGHYGGYYRKGPIETDAGRQPGEVFEVDEKPYEVKDEHGRAINELDENGKRIPVMVGGKQKMDENGKPVFKVKMASFFTPEWMERVNDDADVTNDYPPFQVPSVYKKKNPKMSSGAATVVMPTIPTESPI